MQILYDGSEKYRFISPDLKEVFDEFALELEAQGYQGVPETVLHDPERGIFQAVFQLGPVPGGRVVESDEVVREGFQFFEQQLIYCSEHGFYPDWSTYQADITEDRQESYRVTVHKRE